MFMKKKTEVALEDEIEALRRIANVPKEGSASAMDDEPDESPTVMVIFSFKILSTINHEVDLADSDCRTRERK